MVENKICYNVKEAAEALGISRPKMYELMKIGDFPVFHVGTRVLVPVDRLREWVDKNTAGGGQ